MKAQGNQRLVQWSALTIFLTASALFPLTAFGGGGIDGGGNLQEMDFQYRTRAIERAIEEHKEKARKIFNADPAKLVSAMQSTPVECAKDGVIINTMAEQKKKFWFSRDRQTVFLDCPAYFKEIAIAPAKVTKGLIIHEYARKALGETSKYQYSRLAEQFFDEIEKFDPVTLANHSARFAEIFGIALKISEFVTKAHDEINAIPKKFFRDEQAMHRNRMHCFKPTWGGANLGHLWRAFWSIPVGTNGEKDYPDYQDPKSPWPAEYYANSSEPHCAFYHVKSYENDPRLIEYIRKYAWPGDFEGGYIVYMPGIRTGYSATLAMEKYKVEFERVQRNALEELAAIAKDSSRSPVERSLAIAVRKIVGTRATADQWARQRYFNNEKVMEFERLLSFLAFSAGDWMTITGGDLNVYREFELEVAIEVLNWKVDHAIELATRALASAYQANLKIEEGKSRDIIRSAVFWGLAGTVGWSFLVR